MYLNRVELIGFLGSDAEAKTTPNGKVVTTLSLATKTSFLKDGECTARAEWHCIQAWGKLGEYAAAFQKGAQVRVEGELRSREYQTDGNRVRTYEIVARSILNLRPGQRRAAAADAAADTSPVSDACEGSRPKDRADHRPFLLARLTAVECESPEPLRCLASSD
jgi:single-strand DNA-binding protein